jgi:hypothetical protein
VELRRHIRALAPYEVFSTEWFVMVESLQHIASIALMEQTAEKSASEVLAFHFPCGSNSERLTHGM